MTKTKFQELVCEETELPEAKLEETVTSQVFNLAKHRLATNVMHKKSRKN